MSQDQYEPTRVLASDPTPTPAEASVDTNATQMGVSSVCPVCATANSSLEMFCIECGFLLASVPGTQADDQPGDTDAGSLVDTTSGRRYRLRLGTNTVGREGADVMLVDGTVSRRHATVDVDPSCVRVCDLGSTNGTTIDGVPVPIDQPTVFPTGSVARFGSVALTLEASASISGAPAEATIVMAAGAGTDNEAEAAPAAILSPTGSAPRIALPIGSITIGRRFTNTVVLTGDPYVSGIHATVVCTSSDCTLTDVGSTNGTTLNGVRIVANEPQVLVSGDTITIGASTWQFEATPAPNDAEQAPVDAWPEALPE